MLIQEPAGGLSIGELEVTGLSLLFWAACSLRKMSLRS